MSDKEQKPQPRELSDEQLRDVNGGFNPQPDPPGKARPKPVD